MASVAVAAERSSPFGSCFIATLTLDNNMSAQHFSPGKIVSANT
jgi:hypothetical protein